MLLLQSISITLILSILSIITILFIISIWKIFTKAGQSGWKSLIPVYNFYIILRISGTKEWSIVFLLVPLLNIFYLIVVLIRLTNKFNKSQFFGFLTFLLPLPFIPIIAFDSSKYNRNNRVPSVFWDMVIQRFFLIIALISIFVLFLILVFLIKEGVFVFNHVSVFDFLFKTTWHPTTTPPVFNIFPLIIGSVSVTILASLIAIPFSIAVAVFLAELAPLFIKELVKPFIEIIASIPSVVLGFLGLVVIAPFLQKTFNLNSGWNMFNAGFLLAFMAIPTIASISEDAISSVPQTLKQASLALGANKWQTILFVTLPASLSGISTAVILGISRVVGETMVVLMVAGGATKLPTSIFSPVRPMTSSIAAEMAEAVVGGLHYQALFAIGIVLFIITLIFNILADYLSDKFKFKSQ